MISSADLVLRNKVIDTLRGFLRRRGYLEVDTPIRLPVLIPEGNIEPVQSGEFFLQTSPEICMKRLLAHGHDRLFQIGHCFRKNERGRYHLPEFAMLEWYRAGADYRDLMSETETMVRDVFRAVKPFNTGLPRRFSKITVAEAFSRFTATPAIDAVAAGDFDRLLVDEVEPGLKGMGSVFLYDYPAELASLARLRPDDPRMAERFELYINGVELVNGFSELTDAGEQRQRFTVEIAAGGGAMPEAFLADLENLGPAAGAALGLDRLVMLAADAASIDRVVAFAPEDI